MQAYKTQQEIDMPGSAKHATVSLTLHFHPLSSFCHKALIALYENGTPFTPQIVNLMDEAERTAFRRLWPIGKFPVLRDDARGETVPESSVVIEYLDRHYPGRTRFIPPDAEDARKVRLRDRFFDLYIHLPMQKIVGDRLRPADRKDPHGVEEARTQIVTALDMIERGMLQQPWAIGEAFTLADCAAAPSLFYADKVMPFGATHPHAAAYLERLKQRPSYARVLEEAEPYFKFFPQQ
jgi:glutathione S-transferase